MTWNHTTTSRRVSSKRYKRSGKKRSISTIHRSDKHPCARCARKAKGRYCYSCGHYALGLF